MFNIFNWFRKIKYKSSDSKSIDQIHPIKRSITEIYNVPGHLSRTDSDMFNATRRKLIDALNTPCYICGITKKTLTDSTLNRLGSSQMELHHKLEWSLQGFLELDLLKIDYPQFDWSQINTLDADSWKFFIDSEVNAIILCDICHRGKYHGVHALTWPIWLARKYIRNEDFISNLQSKNLTDNDFVDDLS